MSELHHPLSRQSINLSELRSNRAFGLFVEALNTHLAELRELYETTEASELNRGKVLATKELINFLAEQHIK